MATEQDLSNRLAFIGMDADTRAALREVQPLALKELPGILDAFYAHIAKFPETAKLFRTEAAMRHARDMQIRHWTMIVAGTFDDDYTRSVTAIGEAHHRLGLEPRWYIGGYSFILAGLLRAIETSHAEGWFGGARVREKKAALQNAVSRAALLDMDYAISVYLDRSEAARKNAEELAAAEKKAAEERAAAERTAAMRQLAGQFEKAIGQIVETVSSASTELESSASTLTRTAEEAQRLTAAVAAASAQASSNVQSVATATEEMSAWIIGVRVELTARRPAEKKLTLTPIR